MQAPVVQQELAAGLRAGRWRTGAQMAVWLQQTHGITLCKTQWYYWLGKCNGALKVPRPVHTRKDAAAAVDAVMEAITSTFPVVRSPTGVCATHSIYPLWASISKALGTRFRCHTRA